jgi:hypothetical protein
LVQKPGAALISFFFFHNRRKNLTQNCLFALKDMAPRKKQRRTDLGSRDDGSSMRLLPRADPPLDHLLLEGVAVP